MSHADVLDEQQTTDGTKAYLGHWQPAFRPDVHQVSVTPSPGPEESNPAPRTPVQEKQSQSQSGPLITSETRPVLVHKSAEPIQHYDERTQQTKDIPYLEPDASQEEAPRLPDGDAYGEREDQFKNTSELAPNGLDRRGLRGEDETVANNFPYPQNASSKPQEEPGEFGLSLPIRKREDHDGNGSEMSSEGDEERLDPAWGIKRMDTGQVLAQVQRSPSFPDFVSQREMPKIEPPAHLAMTQAERALQEVEEMTGGYSPFTHESSAQFPKLIRPVSEQGQDCDGPSKPTRSFTADEPMKGNTKAETRFEEGVPLIHEEPDVQGGAQDPAERLADDSLFDISEGTAEAFFSSRPAEGASETRPPPSMDRKATADVLRSLHFSARDVSDSPIDEMSQKLPESSPDENWLNSGGTIESSNNDENIDDISDRWKAALDDDEFLVEDPDELLPDSPPDSPSSFLESLKADEVESEGREDGRMPFDNQSSPDLASLQTIQPSHRSAFQASNPSFAPHQPSTSDLTRMSPSTFGNLGLTRPGISSMNSMQQQFQRPALAPKTESFVDQSKGGYKSPYDLPLELSKPRKRPQMQSPAPPSPMLPPPPRSSSMTSEKPSITGPTQLHSPFSPTKPSFPPHVKPSSSQVAAGMPPKTPPTAAAQAPGVRPPSTSFFEELPIASRPRPPTGQGRYTPQQNGAMAPSPPPLLPQSPPSAIHPLPSRPSAPSHPPSDPYAQYQLQRPERLDPYANVPLQPPVAPTNVATRYSPAPGSVQGAARPTPSPRYSPAPPSQPTNTPPTSRYVSQPVPTAQVSQSKPSPPPPNRYASQHNFTASNATATHPFQPRTSSPLAHFGRSMNPQSSEAFSPSMGNDEASAPMPMRDQERYQSATAGQTPALQFRPGAAAPPAGGAGVLDSDLWPPRRSQTQSPGKRGPVPQVATTSQDATPRPASVQGQTSPVKSANAYDFVAPARTSVRQRGLSQNLNFIPPVGEERNDELQRWKGSPVFRFGFGGAAISSFPKHAPRYGAGSAMPMIKPSAGEIHINSLKEISPLQDQTAKFPGPLRSRSKKKEVLTWLSAKIAEFEQYDIHFISQSQLLDPRKRNEEKILLWKIVKAMVEHDGILEGATGVRKDVNLILSPEVHVLDDAAATQYTADSDLTGIYRPAGSAARSEPVDPVAVDTLRKTLLRGDREKAMWHAVDSRLWAHALLIASTLDRSKWREVVQEFVRREVKIIGANTESLAALYEVFAGNLDESIDELVPPSARAGLQMVSRIDSSGPTRNALDGLDRWRETLSLILNNRSADDHQALAALGGLLARYGRVEASHICFMFSRAPGRSPIFAGADDPSATMVLLGADHRNNASNYFQDEDTILLTEVYEFAISVLSASPNSASMPHFQAYKLQRALVLADNGHRTESQAYCDAISAISKSTTKASPYFGPQFFEVLEELSRRLKQTPTDSSSWIAKPSIEKVSGSVWKSFTNFVAGDESDAESRGSGKDGNFEAGPFANITGTPSLSRTGSTTDLYGLSSASVPQSIPNTMAGSRYAPTSQQFARSPPELIRGRSSLDSQRSPPLSNPIQPQLSNDQASSFGSQSYMPMAASSYQPLGQSPPTNQYQRTPPQTSYMPNGSLESSPARSYRPQQPASYVPTPPPEESVASYMPVLPQHPLQTGSEAHPDLVPAFGDYSPSLQPEHQQPRASKVEYDQPMQPTMHEYGYEPPSETGYVPYEPDPDSDSEKRPDPPRKKSFMDNDEDDFSPVVPAVGSTSSQPNPTDDAAARRRAADAAADEAFKKVAEEDAKKDQGSKAAKAKGSWFGGWLGKKDDSLDSPGEKKVIKARLGEESSFYYDKDLKRWINKKDPNSVQAGPKAAPPPPKGPVGALRGLTPSASLPNLSGPPRIRTPDEHGSMAPPAPTEPTTTDSTGLPAGARPPSEASTPPIGGPGPGLVPPARPSTATSTSSLDDLLGPSTGGGRKSVKGKKGGKGGRYVDLVAATQADS